MSEIKTTKEALIWVRSKLADLCSDTENDPALKVCVERDFDGPEGCYARGRFREARTIYSKMSEAIDRKLKELGR